LVRSCHTLPQHLEGRSEDTRLSGLKFKIIFLWLLRWCAYQRTQLTFTSSLTRLRAQLNNEIAAVPAKSFLNTKFIKFSRRSERSRFLNRPPLPWATRAIPIYKSEHAIDEIQTAETAEVEGIQDSLGHWATELNLAVRPVGVNVFGTYAPVISPAISRSC
jgi:hypothetical protein